MKILNIIQCSNLGGMEQSTLQTMIVLQEAGHDVKMISLQPAGALKSLAEQNGIPISGIENYRFGGLANIGVLLKIIKAYGPDRIWLTGHNFGSLTATHLSGVPTYLSIHFHHCERPMLLWKVFYFLARRWCRGIRFICRYIFEEVSSCFKGDQRVVCFPNIFRKPEQLPDRQAARARIGIEETDFVIGNAGWLIPRKAFDVFLHTAAEVLKELPEALFMIAGDGRSREELEKLAKELGIESRVRFLGWQKNLAEFYRAIDVLLFNSNFDAVGRTPVEALTYYTPVVASVTCGGLGELVRHMKDGFLIDQHDVKAMAEEIIKLHHDPNYREAVARSGHDHVLSLGSRENHLEHLNRMMEL